jgi:hypothetical protein
VGIFGKGDLAVSTSTHFATPLIVVNGPTRTRISLNSTFGALARALRERDDRRALGLLIDQRRRRGRARSRCRRSVIPDATRRRERGSEPTGRPMMPGEFFRPACRPSGYSSGEAPHGISYHASRATRALAGSLGWSMNSKHFPLCLHTMLIVGPRARQDVRRRRMVVGRPQAPSLRVGATAVSRALPRRKPRRGHERPVRRE